MPKHMLLIHADPANGPQPGTPEYENQMGEWFTYTEGVQKAGALVSGEGLQDPSTATTLAVLQTVDLPRYQPFHAARAELLRRTGEAEATDAAYARAIALSANAVERDELQRRRARLRTSDPRR